MKQETKKMLDHLTSGIAEQAALVMEKQMAHDAATSEMEAARSVVTTTMNALNRAQNELDLDLDDLEQDRLQDCINVMRRVVNENRPFDMDDWQTGRKRKTERGLINCGSAACFAGWLSVSPEWRSRGGEFDLWTGEPVINEFHGDEAVNVFLGLSPYHSLGEELTEPDPDITAIYDEFPITAQHVLDRLLYIQRITTRNSDQ